MSTGLAATSVLVLSGAVTQLAAFRFELDGSVLDSSADGGIFGLVGDVALACAAITAWVVDRRHHVLARAVPLLLTFLAVDKVLRLHDEIPHWPVYYVPVMVATLAGLVVIARRNSRRSLQLTLAGLLLLAVAFLVHVTGDAVLEKLQAPEDGWAVQLKAILKHGAELAGWLIITLALLLGVHEHAGPRIEANPTP